MRAALRYRPAGVALSPANGASAGLPGPPGAPPPPHRGMLARTLPTGLESESATAGLGYAMPHGVAGASRIRNLAGDDLGHQDRPEHHVVGVDLLQPQLVEEGLRQQRRGQVERAA